MFSHSICLLEVFVETVVPRLGEGRREKPVFHCLCQWYLYQGASLLKTVAAHGCEDINIHSFWSHGRVVSLRSMSVMCPPDLLVVAVDHGWPAEQETGTRRDMVTRKFTVCFILLSGQVFLATCHILCVSTCF